jgi:hypothetical protein
VRTVAVETSVTFSRHAVERYQERAFPAADLQLAQARLDALAPSARIASRPPGWLAEREVHRSELYLVIGDLVFPLVRAGEDGEERWFAKTCIARGGISEDARRRRNAVRVQRHRSRRVSRRGGYEQ